MSIQTQSESLTSTHVCTGEHTHPPRCSLTYTLHTKKEGRKRQTDRQMLQGEVNVPRTIFKKSIHIKLQTKGLDKGVGKWLSLPCKHEDLSLGSQCYGSPPEMTTQTQQQILMPATWHSLGCSGPKCSLQSTEHRASAATQGRGASALSRPVSSAPM